MIRSILSILSAVVLTGFVGADDKPATAAPKNAAFETLKGLAGEWVPLDKDGKSTDQVFTAFKVTSNGSAIQETIHPGTPMEMVSVYHLDGKDLVMTHYCFLGNQPKVKLDPKSTEKVLKFSFVGGTNLDPAKDMHMHEGTITILDTDRIETAWVGWMNGKADDSHKMTMTLVRKKK